MTALAPDFIAAVLNPQQPIPATIASGTSSAERRFAVYRNNVIVSLIKALQADYPVINTLVGDEFFQAMAGEFVRKYPPQTPIMMDFASEFPTFLESFKPVATLPYLADVSRIERALRQSYHAADSTTLTPDGLNVIATAGLADAHIELAPSFHLLTSPWPVFSIWDDTIKGVRRNPPRNGQSVAITRKVYDPEPRLLLSGEWAFLASLMTGASLGTAMTKAAEVHDGFALEQTLVWLLDTSAITHIRQARQ